ncbi:MAG: hypothetical protein A2150_04075 [Candidatus Muproteobacteria bacterium RBG_16_64_11]|uniref:Probable membrane transporter protein n=1 Tax=Candidatus Muproteobacteria bacterium RBG_16_64_11 TaxID=1817758 RepID=A0A1F6TD24_9PROT|nr:MAG: hypothetical protein A2150_04075 [Candidatus Muproteobacteria bacterium RBG_16_64_11]
MPLEILLAYLAVGAFAGTLAGLLGVGGGLVIVPALVVILQLQGLTDAVIVHLAIGTSLATIALTSLSSIVAHHRRGAVRWPVVRALAPGIVIGALLGAAIAEALPGTALRGVFGVFELGVALQLALDRKPAPHRRLPGGIGMTLAGGVIGAVSGIVGIGGGTLTVPFLAWCNVALRQAVATSAACGFPIAVAGAAGFMAMGWNDPRLPAGAGGYVYWPAFAGIALASVLFAPLGARLTHALPVPLLRRFFALFLAVLGVKMLWG